MERDEYAFPRAHGGLGMSLRDYFAAKALQGMLANSSIEVRSDSPDPHDLSLAKASYTIADAMLKAREGGAE